MTVPGCFKTWRMIHYWKVYQQFVQHLKKRGPILRTNAFKNLFLKSPKRQKLYVIQAITRCIIIYLTGRLHENFLSLHFSWGNTDKVSDALCYLQYRTSNSFMNHLKIFCWILPDIISETLQAPIKTFLQLFEENDIIFTNFHY